MKQAFKIVLGFLMLWATVAQAEIRIEITEGVNSAQPIGVVPFKWAGAGAPPQEVGELLVLIYAIVVNLTLLIQTACLSNRVQLQKLLLMLGLR